MPNKQLPPFLRYITTLALGPLMTPLALGLGGGVGLEGGENLFCWASDELAAGRDELAAGRDELNVRRGGGLTVGRGGGLTVGRDGGLTVG